MAGPELPRPLLCPSGRCEPGAVLLGIVGPNGTVGYLSQRITVDSTFVDVATRGRTPEARFRFAEPCATTGCANWDAGPGPCGVIDEVVESPLARPEAPLPRCSIGAQCRWFAQRHAQACVTCPVVAKNGCSFTTPPCPTTAGSRPPG